MLLLLLTLPFLVAAGTECDPRQFPEGDSVVCVCTADDCDLPGTIAFPDSGSYKGVTSSRDGLRFSQNTAPLDAVAGDASVVVKVNLEDQYQTMIGFGGAFTDSTGINILTLPEAAQDFLIRSYFSPEGIEYNLCRIPIAGSDFSPRPYTYDDVEGDVDLQFFNLTVEDYEYKLPFIRRAKEVADKQLLLFGSPWGPPGWMKENGMINGTGGLLPEMWQPWSNYLVKFVEAYEAEGAPIWGLTTQNEPLTGFEDWAWNTCAWSAEDQRDWIKSILGPTLEAAGLRRLKLMIFDHNRDVLPSYPQTILDDPEANQYVDGTAVHWYADWWTGPEGLDETQSLFLDKFLLYTEACHGWNSEMDDRVRLGAWYRAEDYAFNVIEDINHYSTGWVDWNMALNMGGGPNWAGNYVDSPIIINTETGEFYKQPMFYALGHFSKFIAPGSQRVSMSISGESAQEVQMIATKSPDGTTVSMVILNKSENEISMSIDTGSSKEFINVFMPAKAITTLLFNAPA